MVTLGFMAEPASHAVAVGTPGDGADEALASSEVPAGRGEIETVEPARWQSSVARRSAEARAIVPDADVSLIVDMEAALALATELDCGLTPLYVRACALALREHPEANASYRDGRFERFGRVNVGVVIADSNAYVIATVFDADRKTVPELAAELTELDRRAREGALLAPELSAATFTFADLGPLGLTRSTPLIVPPAAASVSAGSVQAVPVVRNGAIVPGYTSTVTLASDHRILYGAAAAAFLGSIKSKLEEAIL
jgi:pyruvate dehydrogenase E2 component (dihydrolipoamide acetyltransferase)